MTDRKSKLHTIESLKKGKLKLDENLVNDNIFTTLNSQINLSKKNDKNKGISLQLKKITIDSPHNLTINTQIIDYLEENKISPSELRNSLDSQKYELILKLLQKQEKQLIEQKNKSNINSNQTIKLKKINLILPNEKVILVDEENKKEKQIFPEISSTTQKNLETIDTLDIKKNENLRYVKKKYSFNSPQSSKSIITNLIKKEIDLNKKIMNNDSNKLKEKEKEIDETENKKNINLPLMKFPLMKQKELDIEKTEKSQSTILLLPEILKKQEDENIVSKPKLIRKKNKKNLPHKDLKIKLSEKDQAYIPKYNSFINFISKINLTNGISVKIQSNYTIPFKIYVGKGNNSPLIKLIIKQRWWWSIVETFDENVNFVWTQLRNNKFLSNIKTHKELSYNLEKNNLITNESTNDLIFSEDYITDSDESPFFQHKKNSFFERSNSLSRKNKKNFFVGCRSYTKIKNEEFSEDVKKKDKKFTNEKKIKKIIKKKDGNIHLKKIINANDYYNFLKYVEKEKENKMDLHNISISEFHEIFKKIKPECNLISHESSMSFKIHNHLENNYNLSNKKGMFYNMRYYYESIKENTFNYLPVTFHIQNGLKDKEYLNFLEFYTKRNEEISDQEKLINSVENNNKLIKKLKNIWIIKPGEQTNRGTGINLCSELSQIKEIIDRSETHPNGRPKTYIVQLYIDRPFLYCKRKFDIRCYILLTSINGILKGYWYQEGYIRTSSKEFTLKNINNKLIHLTNDAVQKKSDDYGRFESGNKVSYNEFQKYLDSFSDQKYNFINEIYPKMKKTATDAIKSVYSHIDPNRKDFGFEIFGLDFMIDENFKVWLLEINTNPCLELSSALLARIIPNMIENAFRIAIDPIFPPPEFSQWLIQKKPFIPENMLEYNKFELIFDEISDGPILRNFGRNQENRDQIYEIEEEVNEEKSDEEIINNDNED